MTKEFIQAQCECGNEILEVEYWEDEKSFCFVQFKYCPHFYNFRRRLRFLFTGKLYFNEIMINPESAKLLADYINKNINKHVKEEKEEEVGR